MVNFHPLRVSALHRETKDCVSISFDVPDALKESFTFKAGQYLTLRAMISGEDVRRSYSLCSAPHEGIWKVTVKRVDQGRFSTFANDHLQVGDTLDVMPPEGNFHTPLAATASKEYVGFAAGSGITPVISLIKSILHTEANSNFTLFYGNRSLETIIFREEIEALKNMYLGRFSVHYILSGEQLGNSLFSGRLDGEKCSAYSRYFFSPQQVDAFFICGPEAMIHEVSESLKAQKVSAENIHFELFTSPAGKLGLQKTKSKEREFNPKEESLVTIKLDGTSFDLRLAYGGDSILDAALKNGADLPYACKGGVCCTCRAKLKAGEADMDVNYALEPEEVEAGFILTCQSHPRTEHLLVDFDER